MMQLVDVVLPVEPECRARLWHFAARMRRRHLRLAASSAATRSTLALAIPAIAVAWALPAYAIHAGIAMVLVTVVVVGTALWRASRVSDAMLLGASGTPRVGGLDQLGDGLATWLERQRGHPAAQVAARSDRPMANWLARNLDVSITALPEATVRDVGRRRLGRLRWLIPIVILLLLAWLLSPWWQPPWPGALGGKPALPAASTVYGVVREGILDMPHALVTRLGVGRLVLVDAGRPAQGVIIGEGHELLASELEQIDSAVPKALVTLFDADREVLVGSGLFSVAAGSDGSYEIAGIGPGDYVVQVNRQSGWLPVASFEIEVAQGGGEVGVDVWLPVLLGASAGSGQAPDQPEPGADNPQTGQPASDEPTEPPPSEPPAPLLQLPHEQVFVVPKYIADGPTRRMRAHVAEVAGGANPAGQPSSRRTEGGGVLPPAPKPRQEQFDRAAERAQGARHVPMTERAMVRRFFTLLREAAK